MGKAENQVLEIFVIKGRITSLEGETQVVQREVLEAEGAVSDARADRAKFLGDKENAEEIVRKAKQAVVGNEEAVRNLQLAVREARAKVAEAEKKVAEFSSEIQSSLDSILVNSSEALGIAMANRDDLSEKIQAMKQQLAEKQATLKEEGVDLSFDVPRPPKTHSF